MRFDVRFKWSFFAHLFDLLFVYDVVDVRFLCVPYERLKLNESKRGDEKKTHERRRREWKKNGRKKNLRGDIGADQTNKSRKFYTKMHRQKMMEKGKKNTARE